MLLDSVANYQHRIIWAIVFKIEGPALEISEPFFLYWNLAGPLQACPLPVLDNETIFRWEGREKVAH